MSGEKGPKAFDDEWPHIAERLKVVLGHKHLPSWLVDDVVQETGLRLIKAWDRVDPSRSAPGLAITIANNLLWEHARRKDRCEVPGDVPEVADGYDVESAGLARIELGRIKSVLPQLSREHRSVLLAEIGDAGPVTFRGPNAVKMLRMRARRRLSALLDQASAFGAAVLFEARGLTWRAADHLRRMSGQAEHATATAALAVAAILVLPFQSNLLAPVSPDHRGPPSPITSGIEIDSSGPPAGEVEAQRPAISAQGKRLEERAKRGPTSDPDERERPYGISVGDEDSPAEGGATLNLIPEGRGTRAPVGSLPRCGFDIARNREVEARCQAGILGGGARAGARARTDP